MVETVELVRAYVETDLANDTFTNVDRRAFLNGVDDLREQLLTWERDLTDCFELLRGTPQTIYRRRQGDIRHFWVRDGETIYCIGVGHRSKTYDRDLGTVVDRARETR